MTAQAFDLADRFQTPVFVMSDLDLGMNNHMSPPLKWDDNNKYDLGKVLSAEDLEIREIIEVIRKEIADYQPEKIVLLI